MKVTKFPQSCLLVEKNGHRVVIDPGDVFLETHKVGELDGVDAVLYTHQHSDHYDASIADYFKSKKVPLYANKATADIIGDGATTVGDGEEWNVAGFTVRAYDLPHCLLPDGNEGPQNTGYVIDSVLFHPGDGKELSGLSVDTVALPITGPDISILDAINFAKQLNAKVAIPIHYDRIPASPEVFAAYAGRSGASFEVKILGDGESTEL